MTDQTQAQLAQELAKTADNFKALGEDLKGRLEKGDKELSQLRADFDEHLITINEIKSQMMDVAQAAARPQGATEAVKSLGEQFVDTDEYKQLVDDPRGQIKARLQVKSLVTSATTDTDGAAGALIQPQRLGGIIAQPDRLLTIRDLLMPGSTSSNAISYIKETGFTNAAAVQVNEGDKKAQSTIKYGEETVNVATLAHFIKASRQVLDDAPQLTSHINGRLLQGLKIAEEKQLLNGDGLSGNLKGIMTQATTFEDKASMASYSVIDQLRLAMLQVHLAEYASNALVLNPIDFAKIELAKDDNGRYLIGNPQGTIQPTLWGVPVVATQAMGVGKFLTGAFDLAAQIFDREGASVQVGFENDDFTKNLVTILAEQRLALAVYRPEAFVHGTLAAK